MRATFHSTGKKLQGAVLSKSSRKIQQPWSLLFREIQHKDYKREVKACYGKPCTFQASSGEFSCSRAAMKSSTIGLCNLFSNLQIPKISKIVYTTARFTPNAAYCCYSHTLLLTDPTYQLSLIAPKITMLFPNYTY